jgi:primosomal protein N' (replication factor Y)
MHKNQQNYVNILLPVPMPQCFTYKTFAQEKISAENIAPTLGSFVSVPFGKNLLWGVVWELKVNPDEKIKNSIKEIAAIVDIPPMSEQTRAFIEWVANYTISPPGMILKQAISTKAALEKNAILASGEPLKKTRKSKKNLADHEDEKTQEITHSVLTLTTHQQQAVSALQEIAEKEKFSATLLEGVTGSGKTEVYCEQILAALNAGKQALVLLPEIVLSTQLLSRLGQRLGTTPLPWHSNISQAQKNIIWQRIARGESCVVIGARSALFLPFSQLGLIVVDEEHDPSFKQEEGVLYNARDMAIVRAQFAKCPIILASATPALETLANVGRKKYHHVKLPSRYGGATLPQVKLIDMRKEKMPKGQWLSPTLCQAIAETLAAKQQSILFLNRRGYAPLTLCRQCGYRFSCPDCSSWLVEHKQKQILCCHHCGYQTVTVSNCPACKAEELSACGPGVERVCEEAKRFFPQAKIIELTSDVTQNPQAATAFVQAMNAREIDIVVGTQIIAKGHHFPALTLVGVVDADLGLSGGDLRASERTYQLLHQVSGRAGRSVEKGRVFMQTIMPDSLVMRALTSSNQQEFLTYELKSRKDNNMPPFGRLAAIILSGRKEQQVLNAAQSLRQVLPFNDPEITILGPVPAPLYKLRGLYRYRLLIKTPLTLLPHSMINSRLQTLRLPSTVRLKIDIDPQSFL